MSAAALTPAIEEPPEEFFLQLNDVFLWLEMSQFLGQVQTANPRQKQHKKLRVNEPERYSSRCLHCNEGKFDVVFSPTNLEVMDVACASLQCTGDAFCDVPCGYVCPAGKPKKQLTAEVLAPVTPTTPMSPSSTCTLAEKMKQSHPPKRKRGRPPGSKNKKGTKKSRALELSERET